MGDEDQVSELTVERTDRAWVAALVVGFLILFVLAPAPLLLTGAPPAPVSPSAGLPIAFALLVGGGTVLLLTRRRSSRRVIPPEWWACGLVAVATVTALCSPGSFLGFFVLAGSMLLAYVIAVVTELRSIGATMATFWLLILLAVLWSSFVASLAMLAFALGISLHRRSEARPVWSLIILAIGAVVLSAVTPQLNRFGRDVRFGLVVDQYEAALTDPRAPDPPGVHAVIREPGWVAFWYPYGLVDSNLGILYDPSDSVRDSRGRGPVGAVGCTSLRDHWYWCIFD